MPMYEQHFEDHGIYIPSHKRPSPLGDIKMYCPRCHGSRRNRSDQSLSVNVFKGIWHCFNPGCDFAGKLKGYDDLQGFTNAGPQRNWVKPDVQPAEGEIPQATKKFFTDRGISLDVVKRRGIWRDDDGLHFPYYREGEIVNVKTRRHPKSFSMVSGAELCFYGLDDCKDQDTIIIVEGELDALALETATGATNILSVPNGASGSSSARLSYVERDAALLDQAHTIVLAMDNDAPGQKLEDEIARLVGREKCYRVVWPEGAKDANDVLMQHGARAVAKALADRMPYPESGFVSASSYARDYWELYHNTTPPGISTGFASLDEFYTIKPGELTVVTGQPGCGKSEVVDNIVVNLALRKQDPWRFIIYSPENMPPGDYAGKFAEKLIGKPFGARFKGGMSRAEAENALKWVDEQITLLYPELPTVAEILRLAKVKILQTGARGLIIDPWNEVLHEIGATGIETNYISEMLSKIKRFALNHGIHVWVIAHPRKLQKDASEKDYPPATLNDISGSAAWYAKADNGLSVWRSKIPGPEAKPTVIYVQKIRNKRVGKLGNVSLDYQWETGRYFDQEETERGPRQVSQMADPWNNAYLLADDGS